MIIPVPYKSLGHAEHGWLDARHHFSFAEYYNPERMGFGQLRVINDDIVAAGAGFDTHPHRDMEIITYVRQGAITHRDSKGNEGRTQAGDVQVMTAGSGIYHSEYNLENEDTKLYQIWIRPREKGLEPRWESAHFAEEHTEGLRLLVSGDGSAPLTIHQDAYLHDARMQQGEQITHRLHGQGYLLVSRGEIHIGEHLLSEGDGAEILEESITLSAQTDAEIVLIDVPPLG